MGVERGKGNKEKRMKDLGRERENIKRVGRRTKEKREKEDNKI